MDLPIVLSPEQIAARVRALADALNRELPPNALFVVALKGAFVFAADLLRHVTCKPRVDFVRAASYGMGTRPDGEVALLLDVTEPLEGQHVVLVEDIIDTGRTTRRIIDRLASGGAKRVQVVTLLDKPARRQVEVPLDWVGFEMPAPGEAEGEDRFYVGYGLDHAERYRELPYIAYIPRRAATSPSHP